MRNIRIGDYLVEQNLISQEQLEQVLAAQRESQGTKRFGELVVELGFMSEVKFAQALAGKLKVQYVDLANIEIDYEAVRKVPEALAKKHTVIAINIQGKRLTVATDDPTGRMSAYCASPSPETRAGVVSIAGSPVVSGGAVVSSPPSQELKIKIRHKIKRGNNFLFNAATSSFINNIWKRIKLAQSGQGDIANTVYRKLSALVVMTRKRSLDAARLQGSANTLGVSYTMRIVTVIEILMRENDDTLRTRRSFPQEFYLRGGEIGIFPMIVAVAVSHTLVTSVIGITAIEEYQTDIIGID